jgi:hypothetical protein
VLSDPIDVGRAPPQVGHALVNRASSSKKMKLRRASGPGSICRLRAEGR